MPRGKKGTGLICKHRSTSERKRYIPSDCAYCAHGKPGFCSEHDAWLKEHHPEILEKALREAQGN